MRRAQIAVLTLALGAGGIAAVLVMRSGEAVAPPPAPLPQVAMVDILVAKTDIEVGRPARSTTRASSARLPGPSRGAVSPAANRSSRPR